jgi:histidyl-tRNA synthetase
MANDPKLEARTPRGFADRSAAEVRAVEGMLATVRTVYERYGFEPVENPIVEFTDALGKFLPDQDRPNEGVFSFRDDDGQWLSLRYDLTAPLARYVAENFASLPKPYRSYRGGWVFRNEKPGPGRFRQFMQLDADTVGAASVVADAEMCMMAADAMEALGIARGGYVVKVNSRKVLDGILDRAGVAGEEDGRQRLIALRAIDKLDRLGLDGVRALLGPGRRDESGDFTKGAGLAGESCDHIIAFLESLRPSAQETITALSALVAGSARGESGVAELREIAAVIDAAGYADRVRIDPSVVRGLEYYTGPVYEVELTFEVRNEQGQLVRFGSVGGGGRYDGLVGRFQDAPVPATGFSIGVSRLAAALEAIGGIGDAAGAGPVVVLVLDRDRVADYQRLVAGLRGAGIASEMYLGDAGMRAQLRYADRRNSPCVVIQGSDERARGVVQVKDLVEGARLAATISSNREWRDARPAQIEVAESEVVGAVREILARRLGRT